MAYLAGLLSPAERKNSWQLAEISGDPNPYGFQHLLGRADWDPNALRDRLRTYVTDSLAADQAVGVIDETGFLKKGRHSAGVARHYSGTAGRVENCQIGVFLAYASEHGHPLIDRELYLPKEWTEDRQRCRRASIPDEHAFATKPQLARQMLERAFDAGVVLAFLSGDSVYGDDRALRGWLEERKQAYVLAVSGKETVWLNHRSISDPSEVTAYITCASARSTLADQMRVAGMRCTVEESIQCAKGEVGLDHYEVRSWTGWYRHMSLAL